MSTVVRTWKRDGYQNFMYEEDAVKSLGETAVGYPREMPVAHKQADVQRRLRAGEIVHTPLAFFRLAAALAALLLCGVPIWGQQPEWHWTKFDDEEYALWHYGVQAGNYRLSDASYYPRLAPGQWGDACACPCPLPPTVEEALAQYRKTHWKTRGVLMGPTNIRKSNSPGLRYRNMPAKKPLLSAGGSDGIERIPDYSSMPSLTLVAKNEGDARAALAMFEQAPELAAWRDKYGLRAKAYGAEEFRHTGSAFKLDEDRRFQESGFVALIQPDAPDEQGKAEVRSYYSFATPEQALRALRDADPAYDPNPPLVPPATPSVTASTAWEAAWGKAIAGVGLGGSSLVMALGALATVLRTILR